jgi:hypothetical protein
MLIQLDERLVKQLEVIAKEKGKDVNQTVQELIDDYLNHKTEFRAKVQQVLQEHGNLFDRLAKS